MGAASFIGRIGGLAVGLGVGLGVGLVVGAGAASADTGTTSADVSAPHRSAHVERARPKPNAAPPARVAVRSDSPAPRAAARGGSAATTARITPRAAISREADAGQGAHTQLTDGIIHGAVDATPFSGPVVYTMGTGPDLGGKVTLDGDAGTFSYLPDYSALTSGATERFDVVISEQTPVVVALEQLLGSSDFAVRDQLRAFVASLQRAPVVGTVLWPLIGSAQAVTVAVDNGLLVPDPFRTPVAFTVKVISFDGTPISTNFFPAVGLSPGQTAPTVLTTAGLSSSGMTDPYGRWDRSVGDRPGLAGYATPGIAPVRESGYNVVTWDSRGKGASGGILELGAPEYEGRDTQTIITYYTNQGWVSTDPTGDPLIGMMGGSMGGLQQLVAASIDGRIDAIVPAIAPNDVLTSLYPDRSFNTLWGGALLPLALLGAGARVNPEIYLGAVTGTLTDWIPPGYVALLERTGPGDRVADITAPTLLIQGVPDTLFTLTDAVTSAQMLLSAGTPTKMLWYCGGHGVCLNPASPIQNQLILDSTLNWLDRYVKGVDTPELPTFRWVDQRGQFFASDLMPFDPEFAGAALLASGRGGLLPMISGIGGGGPQLAALPSPAVASSRALNAVNLTVTAPAAGGDTLVVGAPALTFTYSGVGLSKNVYAQLVDDQTDLVLGNAVTPVPVVLDGQPHTVTVALQNVAQTMAPGSTLTLQITNTAAPFLNSLALGVVDITAIEIALPTVAVGAAVPVLEV